MIGSIVKARGRQAAVIAAIVGLVLSGMTHTGPGKPQKARAQTATGPLWGFADLHNHQFTNLALGGLVFWGAPFSHDGKTSTAMPWSDWTPTLTGLCPWDTNKTCSREVVTPSGAAVEVTSCPAFGIPQCSPTSPALQGTCPATPCDGVIIHGAGGLGDLINNVLSKSAGHLVGGDPEFDGWPRYNNYTGQQVYYEWLKRAVDGGMRLMVMLAVNNEMLCKFSNHIAAYGCDDMPAVDRQIQAAKDLETFIDQQSGGPGQGWYRIAYSGQQARQIIASGKLAVVLGAEVPGVFGCKKSSACTAASVKSELSRYYSMGVRHMFPTHIVDNAFGGTALYNEVFDFVNHSISGDWWDVGSCPASSGIDFHLDLRDNIQDLARRAQNPGPTDVAAWLAKWAGLTTQNAPPAPPAGGNCNNRGLQSLGQTLIDEMMDKGMIIDVDHTSGLSLQAILQRAAQRRYPGLAMGHTGFIETGKLKTAASDSFFEHKRHEGNKTAAQIETLRALGGMPGVILHQGSVSSIKQYQRPDGTFPVPEVCGNSSETWAQVYLYGAEKMAHQQGDLWPSDPTAVAFGSDFNGLAGMPAPRFGSERCAGDFPGAYAGPARKQVSYPFTVHGTSTPMDTMQAGNKVFDINNDGLANVGMYPDFIEELKQIGMTSGDLDPLFRSAEAYVRMWERSEDRSGPSISCGAPDGQWHATDVTVTCAASDAISGLDDAADASFTLSTNVAAGTETANASTGTRRVCDRRLNCSVAGPINGFKIDKRAPSISITAPVDGGAYIVNEPLTAKYSCADGGSGLMTCAGTQPSETALSTATAGPRTFTVTTSDNVRNSDSLTVHYSVTYRVCAMYDTTKPLGTTGSTVPIRVRLCDLSGANLSTPLVTLTAREVDGAGPPPFAGSANNDFLFRYDPKDQLYVYNLRTSTYGAGAHTMSFDATGDPIRHTLEFRLR